MVRIKIKLPWEDAQVYYKERTGSTMADARALVDEGKPHGTIAMASYQENGRGRFKTREWVSSPGKNLLFTLIFSASSLHRPVTVFPLLAGLAVSLVLEQLFDLKALIKWPNDIFINNRKVSGILCEEYGDAYLVGIGLNCNQTGFSGDLGGTATSLRNETHRFINIFELLENLMSAIKKTMENESWKTLIQNRLYAADETVKIVVSGPAGGKKNEYTGRIAGITDEGALAFMDESTGKTLEIYSGELMVNPGSPA
ncbi:MAG: biotin--[acetyl-CoA-carboxylase] ligase [Spirochaetales bacterium]|nr:biotin--[acetyl-CoA-carboxylase] ligase [Spirochaetales bacterium]